MFLIFFKSLKGKITLFANGGIFLYKLVLKNSSKVLFTLGALVSC